jgi:hypothetical protein
MQPDSRTADSDAGSGAGNPSALVLVRCWLEPCRGGDPVLRGYVRDLRTGMETPIADMRSIEDQVRKQLQLPAQRQHESERRLTA